MRYLLALAMLAVVASSNGCSSSSSAGTVQYTEESFPSMEHIGPIVPTSSGLFVMHAQTATNDNVYSTDLTEAGTELLLQDATVLTVDSQAGVWRGRAILVDWDIVAGGYADHAAIWLSDGTLAGTEMVSEIDSDPSPFEITYARLDGNRLIILGNTYTPNVSNPLGDPKIISIDLD